MRTAADLFFRPGKDAGLSYIAPPLPILIPAQPARVRQFPGSDFPEVESKIRKRLEARWRPGANPAVFQIGSSPVLLTGAQFRRHGVLVEGRWLLNGANGDEVLTRYMRRVGDHSIEDAVTEALSPDDEFRPVPTTSIDDPDIPFAITMRNGHNYYHFMTEVMPQLAIIARLENRSPVFIHLPDLALLRPFAMAYIRALYPDLAERVRFTDAPTRYDRVLTIYNHRHYLYQTNDPLVKLALRKVPEGDAWHSLSAARKPRKFAMKSSVDLGLKLLRQDALGALEGMDLSTLPRRIFVGRNHAPGSPRFRDSPGQEALVAALRDDGFEETFMEQLSPTRQIAAFHAADQIVAPHGAGLANMIFARRSATVVEIGTAQTQLHRWGDFLQNAHASQCRYFTVFADVNVEDPRTLPPISSGLRGARIGKQAIERILSIVQRTPQATSSVI